MLHSSLFVEFTADMHAIDHVQLSYTDSHLPSQSAQQGDVKNKLKKGKM